MEIVPVGSLPMPDHQHSTRRRWNPVEGLEGVVEKACFSGLVSGFRVSVVVSAGIGSSAAPESRLRVSACGSIPRFPS